MKRGGAIAPGCVGFCRHGSSVSEGDDAQQFVERGLARAYLLPAGLREGAYALGLGGAGQLAGGLPSDDQVVQFAGPENFEDAHPAAVARAATAWATPGRGQFSHVRAGGRIQAEGGQGGAQGHGFHGRAPRTVGAQAPDQALRDDELDRGSHEKRFDTHVHQAG